MNEAIQGFRNKRGRFWQPGLSALSTTGRSVTAHDVDQQLFTVIYAGRDGGEEAGLAELLEIAADRAADPNPSSRRSSRSQGS
jgi:hypothetical protein